MAEKAPTAAADFFLLRTPAMPTALLAVLRAEYAAGIDVLDSKVLQHEFIREALFLASPSLYSKVYAGAPVEDTGRLSLSVARYLYRMCTRCTPFGLFAGVCSGTVSDRFELGVVESEKSLRACRLDQAIVSDLKRLLFRGPESLAVLRDVELTCNDSLWNAPDGLRYVEGVRAKDKTEYRLARIELTEPVFAVLERLKKGPARFQDIAIDLAGSFETEITEVEQFLANLVREQVLVPLPDNLVSGDIEIDQFVTQLLSIPAAAGSAIPLAKAASLAREVGLDSSRNIRLYEEIVSTLKTTGAEINESNTIQVDLHKQGRAPELPKSIVENILAQIWALRSVLVRRSNEPLEAFADKFTERYGDASVPLREALDDDFGIGFGNATRAASALLDHLAAREGEETNESVRPADKILLRKAYDAALAGEREIILTDSDLKEVTKDTDELPSSFSLLGSFAAESQDALRSGQYVFDFLGLYGVPALSLFGRFCGSDKALTEKVRSFVRQTESDTSDLIFAEVMHMVDGHAANVVLRPLLREYEIPFMGRSGAPPAAQIDVGDLYVTCKNRRVVLFSRKLNKRVIPRLTTAHVHFSSKSAPIYRFLGALQSQEEPVPAPFWPSIAGELPFLPALRYRNIRLTRPEWHLRSAEVDAIRSSRETQLGADFLRLLKNGAPGRHIRVKHHDNFLELDLAEKLDRALLIEECRRNATLTLEEVPRESQDLAIDAAGRALRQEIVIPVFRAHPGQRLSPIQLPAPAPAPQVPGGEWLYVRMFCGPSVADRLVTELFPAFAANAEAHGCKAPFFIRYWQNGSHLRLRVRGPSAEICGRVRDALEEMLHPYLTERSISRFEYASYQPEFLRYGGEAGLGHCEQIFAADSIAVSRALAVILQNADSESARWQFGLVNLFALIRDFEVAGCESSELARHMSDGYFQEYRFGTAERRELNDKYRKHRAFVDMIVKGTGRLDPVLDDFLRERSEAIREPLVRLNQILAGSALTEALASIVHMAANRLFPGDGKLYELVLLHFIGKSAASFEGRQRFESRQRLVSERDRAEAVALKRL